MSGAGLTVKATLTADGSGLSGAAKAAVSDLNQIKGAAQGVSGAAKEMQQATQAAGAAVQKSSGDATTQVFGMDGAVKRASASFAVFEKTLGRDVMTAL